MDNNKLYKDLVTYIDDELLNAIDKAFENAPKYVEGYHKEYASDANISEEVDLRYKLAELVAENLMKNAPDNMNEMYDTTLIESKWEHQLSSGTKLRKAIDNKDYKAVKFSLENCVKELQNIIPVSDAFDNFIDEMLTLLDVDVYSQDTEYVEEQLDEALTLLYDICDKNNIWIPLY